MLFSHFRSAVLNAETVQDSNLRISSEGALKVQYAPFDHINHTARLIILGITPGEKQANDALKEAKRSIKNGLNDAEALESAKAHASFSGPMRHNLVSMLDFIGVNSFLGIESCGCLWTSQVSLVQFSSVLRYPVFKYGKNYTGSSPKINSSTLLREQLFSFTAEELISLPNALILPLGPAVDNACTLLENQGVIETSRVIRGIPHPSGANAERIAYFLGRKNRKDLSSKTNPDKIDFGRSQAVKILAAGG